jgi:hypothetical protein
MSDLLTLPSAARQRIEAALERPEIVRWSGASGPDRRGAGFRRIGTVLQVLFGIGAIGTGLVIASKATPQGGSFLAWEIPVVFGLVGGISLIMALFDLRAQARRRAREAARLYAVTGKRVLSFDGEQVTAIAPQQLRYVDSLEFGDGRGDVHIDYGPPGARTHGRVR